MPAQHKTVAQTPDDLKAQGYALFRHAANIDKKFLGIWARPSIKEEGWQYLVSVDSLKKGMQVLNLDAPLDRVPEVATLVDMLLASKILRKQPCASIDWTFNIEGASKPGGNFSAASFRDRAVDECILHELFNDPAKDLGIRTFSSYVINGANLIDSKNDRTFAVTDWLKDRSALTPAVVGCLNYAILLGDFEAFSTALKNKGSSGEGEDSSKENPLHFCAKMGRDAMVPALTAAGHDPNALNARGMSAMHVAADRGHASVCAALYKNGADPMKVNAARQTPLAMAEAAGHADVIHHLRTIVASNVARAALKEMLAPPYQAIVIDFEEQ